MPSPWRDLDRPPLSAPRLSAQLGADGFWREVRVVAQTASTNADAAVAARQGAAEGLVVVAEHQTGGRGRLDRAWSSPARAGLLLSVLLRPEVPPEGWFVLPLLAGLAVCEALESVGGVAPELKWPNDVLVGGRKIAGLLAEQVPPPVASATAGAVIGIGLNVSTRAEELPGDFATSLLLAGGVTDRETVLKAVLRRLAARYLAWSDTQGDSEPVLAAYRHRCATIGQQVSVQGVERVLAVGRAEAVDAQGRLVVVGRDGAAVACAAGDVVHLRREV